ncbi:ISSpo3, transposase [Parvularcula bermudensis HTCC2503]|uniref:ISSpo3, transposase n=1 Tax=Parvularcula bermudensis (strain ATCC BAA-594 / HTCC2503 / KCTC 12087) TaxID=314260 RepID=E0TD16_PARBH|nr:ISSpo3, transposase [Parvularcula bermudensis HTCC2503]
MVMAEKGGNVVTRVLEDRKQDKLFDAIEDKIKTGSTIHTDELRAYIALRDNPNYIHKSVNHSGGEYVAKCGATTNELEGFWNLFKAAYRGTYVCPCVEEVSSPILWQV